MKMAAAQALAKLTKEPVPEEVLKAYEKKSMSFGREYLIPTPFDPRLLYVVSIAVAKAAMETGVARKPIKDWKKYESELKLRIGGSPASNAINSPKGVVPQQAGDLKI